jgi:hypothetical protein
MWFFETGKAGTVALMASRGKRIRTLDTLLKGIAGDAEDSKPHNSPLDHHKEMCKTHPSSSIQQQLRADPHYNSTD